MRDARAQMAIASATPGPHPAERVAAALPDENAATIPTISAASTPSRRPITKVGSIGGRV